MKRATKIAATAGAALSLGLAAAVALAQPYGPGPGRGMGPGYGMHGHAMGYGMGPGHGLGNAQDRLAGLKSELGITAAQESAWQAFSDNVQKQAANRQARFDRMREARSAGSAPERLAQRSELMKQHQAELEGTAAALKDLYAVLTPEQRTLADRHFGGFNRGPGRGAGFGPAARR